MINLTSAVRVSHGVPVQMFREFTCQCCGRKFLKQNKSGNARFAYCRICRNNRQAAKLARFIRDTE